MNQIASSSTSDFDTNYNSHKTPKYNSSAKNQENLENPVYPGTFGKYPLQRSYETFAKKKQFQSSIKNSPIKETSKDSKNDLQNLPRMKVKEEPSFVINQKLEFGKIQIQNGQEVDLNNTGNINNSSSYYNLGINTDKEYTLTNASQNDLQNNCSNISSHPDLLHKESINSQYHTRKLQEARKFIVSTNLDDMNVFNSIDFEDPTMGLDPPLEIHENSNSGNKKFISISSIPAESDCISNFLTSEAFPTNLQTKNQLNTHTNSTASLEGSNGISEFSRKAIKPIITVSIP